MDSLHQPPTQDAEDALPVALSGKLDIFSIIDIVQMVAHARKSGRLTVISEGATSHLYFHAGDIVDAKNSSYEGEEAFLSALQIKEGFFEFRPLIPRIQAAMKMSMTHLLLEAIRRMDEAAR